LFSIIQGGVKGVTNKNESDVGVLKGHDKHQGEGTNFGTNSHQRNVKAGDTQRFQEDRGGVGGMKGSTEHGSSRKLREERGRIKTQWSSHQQQVRNTFKLAGRTREKGNRGFKGGGVEKGEGRTQLVPAPK